MVDETIRYNVEVDTAQLSEQLMRARQEIDNTMSNVSISAGGFGSGPAGLQQEAIQNQSMIQSLIDRSESWGARQLEQIKHDNFMVRANMPFDLSERSALENFLGGFAGFGYDPATTPMGPRRYMEESWNNFAFRIPIIGTEYPDNLKLANYLRRVSSRSVGGRLDTQDAISVASEIRNLDMLPQFRQEGFTREEVMSITNTMATQGDFVSARDPQDYVEKIKQAMGSVREVIRALEVSSEDAVKFMGTLSSLGLDRRFAGDIATEISAMGSSVGFTPTEMLSMAQTGGQIASALGINPAVGFYGFSNLASDIERQKNEGDLTKWRVNSLGGTAGAATTIAQAAGRFSNSGAGIMLAAQGQGIGSISDLYRIMDTNELEASKDPKGVVENALTLVADLLRNHGVDPTPGTVSRVAERFGIPRAAALLILEMNANMDPESALQAEGRELTEEARLEMDATAVGGFLGVTNDFTDIISRMKRGIGGWAGDQWSGWVRKLVTGETRRDLSDSRRSISSVEELQNVLKTGVNSNNVITANSLRQQWRSVTSRIDAYDAGDRSVLNPGETRHSLGMTASDLGERFKTMEGSMSDRERIALEVSDALETFSPEMASEMFDKGGKIDVLLTSQLGENASPELIKTAKDVLASSVYSSARAMGEVGSLPDMVDIDLLSKVSEYVDEAAVVAKDYEKSLELRKKISGLGAQDQIDFFGMGGLEKTVAFNLLEALQTGNSSLRVSIVDTHVADNKRRMEEGTQN